MISWKLLERLNLTSISIWEMKIWKYMGSNFHKNLTICLKGFKFLLICQTMKTLMSLSGTSKEEKIFLMILLTQCQLDLPYFLLFLKNMLSKNLSKLLRIKDHPLLHQIQTKRWKILTYREVKETQLFSILKI